MKIIVIPDGYSLKYLVEKENLLDEKVYICPLFEGEGLEELRNITKNKDNVNLILLSEAGVNISQKEISKISCSIVNKIRTNNDEVNRFISIYANMYSLYLHIWVEKIYVLNEIYKKYSFAEYLILGRENKKFNFPERVDVKTLYNSSDVFTYLASVYFKSVNAKFKFTDTHKSNLVRLKYNFRSILLNAFKFSVILSRKLKINFNDVKDLKHANIAILIRAQSEYFSIKPLLELLKSKNISYVLLQDDLIKNPSGKEILDQYCEDYIPIHNYISIYELIWSWIKNSYKFFKPEFSIVFSNDEANTNVIECIFTNENVAWEWVRSGMHSKPELNIFLKELTCAKKINKFTKFITLDMVDQWAAAIYEFCHQNCVETHIIQNTVLDNIYYPRSVLSDNIYVSGKLMSNILQESNSSLGRIFSVGLPIHDVIHNDFTPYVRVNKKCVNIVVATQPFVQTYPYNDNLINDLIDVLVSQKINSNVIIKPHPRENTDIYKHLVKEISPPGFINLYVSDESNILNLTKSMDVFVSRTSTAIQSIALLGRICISYLNEYPNDICARLDYLNSDMVLKANNKYELNEIFINIKNDFDSLKNKFDSDREEYIEKYIGLFDGQASKRIVELIFNAN